MAYTAAFEPKVVRSYPGNLAKEIPNNVVIKVDFNTDLDRDNIVPYFQITDELGNRIEGQVAYNERTISFVPKRIYGSSQTVRVTIVGDDLSGKGIGIRSVLGERMRGNFSFSFTVAAVPQLPAPNLVYPRNQTVIDKQPTFRWEPVDNAEYYQIEVSKSNTMNPVLWPHNAAEYRVYDVSEDLDPQDEFEDGIYYWRVRAVNAHSGPGEWSLISIFNKDTIVEGTVVDEDTLPPYMPEYEEFDDEGDYIEILEVFPEDGFSNVGLNLKTMYVRVLGTYTKEQVQNSFRIEADRVDGDDSDPILVHSNVEGIIDVIHDNGTTIITFTFEPLEVTENGV